MKSQTSTEFTIIIAMVLVIILVFVSFFFDYQNVSEKILNKNSGEIWKNSPVGINDVILYNNRTEIYLTNNNRINIDILNISFNNISMGVSAYNLSSGKNLLLISDVVLDNPKLDIFIFYKLSNSQNYFNLTNSGIFFISRLSEFYL